MTMQQRGPQMLTTTGGPGQDSGERGQEELDESEAENIFERRDRGARPAGTNDEDIVPAPSSEFENVNFLVSDELHAESRHYERLRGGDRRSGRSLSMLGLGLLSLFAAASVLYLSIISYRLDIRVSDLERLMGEGMAEVQEDSQAGAEEEGQPDAESGRGAGKGMGSFGGDTAKAIGQGDTTEDLKEETASEDREAVSADVQADGVAHVGASGEEGNAMKSKKGKRGGGQKNAVETEIKRDESGGASGSDAKDEKTSG